MKFADFDYHLPEGQIARHPAEPRDAARLCVLDRANGSLRHLRMADLPTILASGDLLVANDTRVRPARLTGRRASGAAVEVLLVAPAPQAGAWRALVKPAKKLREGEVVELENGALRATMVQRADREWILQLACDGDVDAVLDAHGRMPLPPYILKSRGAEEDPAADRARYQTIFAAERGAIAAPTAGLHFTAHLLDSLAAKGIERTSLTLHVGLGTFAAVEVEDLDAHRMHSEEWRIHAGCAEQIAAARQRGARVVAVGTTSARVLETAAAVDGVVRAGSGWTDIFLRPGVQFRACDALLTNFHLPQSTLLVLVSAFAGRERVLSAYNECARLGYRFYSYGDAMLIV